MLRLNDTIRLTATEAELFKKIALDSAKTPTTVEAFNTRLDFAADTWAEGDSPEERLAAALALDMKI